MSRDILSARSGRKVDRILHLGIMAHNDGREIYETTSQRSVYLLHYAGGLIQDISTGNVN